MFKPRLVRLGGLGIAVIVAVAAMAPTFDYDSSTHTYGSTTCGYGGYSGLDVPAYAALTYTHTTTPVCSNIYVVLYSEAVDCNLWYIQTHYSDRQLAGSTDKRFYAMTTICNASGLAHQISIAGVDESPALTTDAY